MRARIPSFCCTIIVHINNIQEGYPDGSSIPHNEGKGAWLGLLEEVAATVAIYKIHYLDSPDIECG